MSGSNNCPGVVLIRQLELSSMSGPFERQSIHLPESERPAIVMSAPLTAHLHSHHSAVPQQYGLPLETEDKLPRGVQHRQ